MEQFSGLLVLVSALSEQPEVGFRLLASELSSSDINIYIQRCRTQHIGTVTSEHLILANTDYYFTLFSIFV